MDSLIWAINKLQDVFNTVDDTSIELPQIVVVGNQVGLLWLKIDSELILKLSFILILISRLANRP